MKDPYQLLLKSFQHPQLAFHKLKRYLDHQIEDTLRILSSRESAQIINQK